MLLEKIVLQAQDIAMDEESVLSVFDGLINSGMVLYDNKQVHLNHTEGELQVSSPGHLYVLYVRVLVLTILVLVPILAHFRSC